MKRFTIELKYLDKSFFKSLFTHHYSLFLHPSVWAIFLVLFSACASFDATKYQEASKKWEKEIQSLEAKDKAEKDPENAILFVGSSSIRLWKNIVEDMKPYPVIQRGYGGSNFADNLFYIERLVKPHNPKAIALFSANDITGSPNDKKPEEVQAVVKELVKRIRKIHSKTPIFIIEVTPTNSRWKVWSEIKQVNSLLKNMCSDSKKLYLIETASEYLNSEGKPRGELFIQDQLHQNQQGYDIWASLIKKRLGEVLK